MKNNNITIGMNWGDQNHIVVQNFLSMIQLACAIILLSFFEMASTENKFREDLWFRLNVFPIYIPPLRDRAGDIHELAQYFVSHKCKEMNIPVAPALSPSGLRKLETYHWPGNVRELENVIERELILHPNGPLSFIDLIPQNRDGSSRLQSSESPHIIQSLDEIATRHIQNAITRCNGKISGPGGAAEMLCINESSLRSKMKKLGISFGRRAVVIHKKN